MKTNVKLLILLMLLFLSAKTFAQFNSYGVKGGVQFNELVPFNEWDYWKYDLNFSYLLRGFVRVELNDDWETEFGAGYGLYSGDDENAAHYNTTLIPIDARILYSPFNFESINPYGFAGIGLTHFSIDDKPTVPAVNPVKENGWTASIPFGIGAEFKLSDNINLDVSTGFAYSFSDDLNYYNKGEFNDAYLNLGVGLTFGGDNSNSDNDKDGLTKREESELGTDPDNADTDGDGLNDGDEFKKYHTNPKNIDSDNDGLKDGEEVKVHNTNPNKADSDNDGLNDYTEIYDYNTNPNNADTDADELNDGEEVNNYKTDVLKADSDNDGLNDGAEIKTHKTNPLMADTDNGTINDGEEVKRDTNPNDASDDISKKETEEGISFDNVYFGFDKYSLTKEAKNILDNVVKTSNEYSKITITLSGHADNIGSDNYNMKLSQKRAQSVKEYLVEHGISESNIVYEFFGESKPAIENSSKQNREKDRRVEIKATVIKIIK